MVHGGLSVGFVVLISGCQWFWGGLSEMSLNDFVIVLVMFKGGKKMKKMWVTAYNYVTKFILMGKMIIFKPHMAKCNQPKSHVNNM